MRHDSDAEILAFMKQERDRCTIDWERVLEYLRNSSKPIDRRMAELWDKAIPG